MLGRFADCGFLHFDLRILADVVGSLEFFACHLPDCCGAGQAHAADLYTELRLGVGRVHYGEREDLVVCTERGHHV